MPKSLTCLRALNTLCACLAPCLYFLLAFAFFQYLICHHFFTCFIFLPFFTCLTLFYVSYMPSFFHALRVFISYVLYKPSFFYLPSFFTCVHFYLRAFTFLKCVHNFYVSLFFYVTSHLKRLTCFRVPYLSSFS